jgi:phage-related protein (TIGR01555 family)
LFEAARARYAKPSLAEQAMGLQAKSSAQALDFFSNMLARTGYGNPNLAEAAEYPLVRLTFNYWELISLYEGGWIPRRIVDVPAQDMCKAWPSLTSDISPKELTRIDRALRRTNAKNNLLMAMQWGRLFGGAGCLIVVKGHEHDLDQPLDLDDVPVGGFKGLIPFERWSGIHPNTDYCTDLDNPIDFNLPESYEVQASGGHTFKVHASRILRFTGPTVPTPEREAYSMWGISVIEPVMQELKKRDNVSWNIANLTFRANILGMKFPELAQMLSGLGGTQMANQKFEERMMAVNHLISNQSLVPLPKDGGMEQVSYSFSGLGEVYQQFCLDISGAAQIPVARLWGRTITGLGQTGDGDEKIYVERIATDQDVYLRPQLEKLYPVLCASELGEVPDDLDLNFPSLAVPDDKEKAELAKAVVDSVTVALNGGLISPRTAAKELKQSSDKTGIFTNIQDEDIAKLSDEVQSEGELGGDLFGAGGDEPKGGGGGLNPASSPAKALKEDDRVAKERSGPGNPGQEQSGHAQGHPGAEDEGMRRLRELARAADVAPSGLKPGDRISVNGKLLTVREVVHGTKDLFDNPTVQVRFETGEAVPYRTEGDVIVSGKRNQGRGYDADGPQFGDAIDVHGLTCVIETPKGGVRSGDGWSITLPYDYGYIKGVEGSDGDSLDVALGDGSDNGWIYCIDQRRVDSPEFDEHKVFARWPSAKAALDAYAQGHHLGQAMMMDWTPMRPDEFKRWCAEHDMSKPCSERLQ